MLHKDLPTQNRIKAIKETPDFSCVRMNTQIARPTNRALGPMCNRLAKRSTASSRDVKSRHDCLKESLNVSYINDDVLMDDSNT